LVKINVSLPVQMNVSLSRSLLSIHFLSIHNSAWPVNRVDACDFVLASSFFFMILDFYGPNIKREHRLDHKAMEKRDGEVSHYARSWSKFIIHDCARTYSASYTQAETWENLILRLREREREREREEGEREKGQINVAKLLAEACLASAVPDYFNWCAAVTSHLMDVIRKQPSSSLMDPKNFTRFAYMRCEG